MKKSKFYDSQIMDALWSGEAGLPVPDLCGEVGISTATFYKWCAKYCGMDTLIMSLLKKLEEENRRLNKIYIEEKLKAEIASVADWRLRLTNNNRSWGFGLSYLYLRNVKGFHCNHKRIYRIYRELEQNLRIKPRKRLVRDKLEPLSVPQAINELWSMDFLHD